jgi:hypothetical protein
MIEYYSKLNERVCLNHFNFEYVKLLGKAGSMVEVNMIENPEYIFVTE